VDETGQMNSIMESSEGPLRGVLVIELGQVLAGPFCSALLADLGATVIKVERPKIGDPIREWGPSLENGEHLWFPILARNKYCVTADLHQKEGKELVSALIKKADILIENFRPGTLEKFGLGYELLTIENPSLIMIRVSGFGQSGPYAKRPGYGSIGEAMGGLRYITGDPTVPPSRVGISIGDSLAGLFGAVGGLAALHERRTSGKGQVVDVAIYESVLAVMESMLPDWTFGGVIRERSGSVLPHVAPSNVYPTADGAMVLIAANQDTVFTRLAGAMGTPELAQSKQFRSHGERGKAQKELDDLIAQWTVKLNARDLTKVLEEYGVPFGFIYRAPEMLTDEHFVARDSIAWIRHPVLGSFPMQNVTPKLSRTPGVIQWTGPALGQHNELIWGNIVGLSNEQMSSYREKAII